MPFGVGVVVCFGELVLSGAVLKALAKNPIAALGGFLYGMCPVPDGALDVGSYGSTPQPGWSRGLFRASRSCWWVTIW